MPKVINYNVLAFSNNESCDLVIKSINDGWIPLGAPMYSSVDGFIRQPMIKYDKDIDEQLNALQIYASGLETENADLRQLLSKREEELCDSQLQSGMWKESTEKAERWSRWCPPMFQVFCMIMIMVCFQIGVEKNRAYVNSFMPRTIRI